MVYNDECFLRVLDGITGAVLFETANSTRTGSEFPIIVDVDGDYNAEIVVVGNNDQIGRDNCEDNYPGYPVGGTAGVFVYGDAGDNWVPTRRIWNQHAYHITNILDDGTVLTDHNRDGSLWMYALSGAQPLIALGLVVLPLIPSRPIELLGGIDPRPLAALVLLFRPAAAAYFRRR